MLQLPAFCYAGISMLAGASARYGAPRRHGWAFHAPLELHSRRLCLVPPVRRFQFLSTSASATHHSRAASRRRHSLHLRVHVSQNRGMSTPTNHKPLEKPPKTPAIARPSSRYTTASPLPLPSVPDSTKRPPHLAHEPDPFPPARTHKLFLRLCPCLPRRRLEQHARRRHPSHRLASAPPRWPRVPPCRDP